MELTCYTDIDVELLLKGSKFAEPLSMEQVFKKFDTRIKYRCFGERVEAHRLTVTDIKIAQLRKQQKITFIFN